MESLWLAAETVLPLFLMMAVGYVIRLAKVMDDDGVRQANKAVFAVFLPLLIFRSILNSGFSGNFRSDLLLYVLAGLGMQFILSLCISVLAVKEPSRRGVMAQGMFWGNFVLFGVPVCSALFGEQAAGSAALLTAVILPIDYIFSVISLELFHGGRPSLWSVVKGVFTNPLIFASVLGILFLFFDISLPSPVYQAVSGLAEIATPLAFVLLGASFGFREIGGCLKDLSIALVVKLLFFPALFLGLAVLLGFRGSSLAVLLAVFASPAAVSSFTMAQQMGGDHRLAGQIVVFSSLFSIATIFLFIFILKQFAFL